MSLKTSATTLVENARARIEGIETSEAINMMNDPDVIIVDIRDIRERQRSGHIPGSFHALPCSRFLQNLPRCSFCGGPRTSR